MRDAEPMKDSQRPPYGVSKRDRPLNNINFDFDRVSREFGEYVFIVKDEVICRISYDFFSEKTRSVLNSISERVIK